MHFVYLASEGWRSGFCCCGHWEPSVPVRSSATVGSCGPLFDLEVFLVSYSVARLALS